MPDESFRDMQRLSTVGFICAVWALFEAHFAYAIWYMLGLDMGTGKIVTGGLDIRPRANMAVNLARHLKVPADLRNALETARQIIDDGLDQRRNLVVHGIYNTITDDGIIIELHRGKNRNARHFSDTELQRLSDDILAAERALHAVVVKYYLDAASIARNTRSAASDSDSESRS